MKKFFVFVLFFAALACSLGYYKGLEEERAANLIWAAYEANLTAVKNALEDGAQMDWVMYIDDPQRHYQNAEFTPLLAAASGGNDQIVRLLLKLGDNPNYANLQGWTALFVAVRDGHAETAAKLVQEGADPNPQTDTGATPLILAMTVDMPDEEQRLKLIEYLLKRGADPNLKTKWDTDALFYAVTELQSKEAVQLLAEHHADFCRRYDGKTILQIAAGRNPKIIPALSKAYGEKCKSGR